MLLFRTAGMDCLQRTDAASATHIIYVPMLLLANIIGPHMKHGEYLLFFFQCARLK